MHRRQPLWHFAPIYQKTATLSNHQVVGKQSAKVRANNITCLCIHSTAPLPPRGQVEAESPNLAFLSGNPSWKCYTRRSSRDRLALCYRVIWASCCPPREQTIGILPEMRMWLHLVHKLCLRIMSRRLIEERLWYCKILCSRQAVWRSHAIYYRGGFKEPSFYCERY